MPCRRHRPDGRHDGGSGPATVLLVQHKYSSIYWALNANSNSVGGPCERFVTIESLMRGSSNDIRIPLAASVYPQWPEKGGCHPSESDVPRGTPSLGRSLGPDIISLQQRFVTSSSPFRCGCPSLRFRRRRPSLRQTRRRGRPLPRRRPHRRRPRRGPRRHHRHRHTLHGRRRCPKCRLVLRCSASGQ